MEANNELIKREEAKLEQAYSRVGRLAVELWAAEDRIRELDGRREVLQSQIDYIAELEDRLRRENYRREELERELEVVARAILELDVQRAATHAAETQLRETKERYTKLVEQNIAELTKCEEARANNEALRNNYASLVQHGKDLLAQCQMAEMTNARLTDTYSAIMRQHETLKKDLVTAGPQVQIYGNVALADGSPEESYAVLAPDGTLLGTGMTQSKGWIAYGPIAASYKEVDVRVGGVTRRVVTSPWTVTSAASPAPQTAGATPPGGKQTFSAPPPFAPAAEESISLGDVPDMAYTLQTFAASVGR